MPSQKTSHKLLPQHKTEVCLCIALGYNAERIIEHLKDIFKVEVTRHNIYQNYIKSPKWQARAQDLAEKLDAELIKHPLAKKVNRLNILLKAINEALIWRDHKIYFDKDGDELARLEKLGIGNIASLVKEARAEVEGEEESGPTIYNIIYGHRLAADERERRDSALRKGSTRESVPADSDTRRRSRLGGQG